MLSQRLSLFTAKCNVSLRMICVVCSEQCVMYENVKDAVCIVQCVVCRVLYAVYNVQCTTCSIQCLVYIVQYVVCSVQSAVNCI